MMKWSLVLNLDRAKEKIRFVRLVRVSSRALLILMKDKGLIFYSIFA